ncbi:proteasome regulatory particle base subunit rpn10 [Basidiobolus ranarum]|uniref:Proteasome regulatory particle base subunit rpn10 n=1 Tax=Basidiobolus ranarum TaxID=34480 RepID=A0ABR2WBR4_9FUNG
MVLEATMLILDNSEWMRNGDYTPTRLEAQGDAVNLIFNSKFQSNPENTVGLMTMARKGPEVLVTLTRDVGKILNALHNIKVEGNSNLTTGIQIAQLALKHRQNKNQQQRIIVFVGSPVSTDEKSLVKLAKKMKKNNIAIDVINFGEEGENTSKLEAFITAVNSNDNSHLVTIPPGPHILSDILLSSPIFAGEGSSVPGYSGSGGSYELGVDPNLDPELALALRISLEEEKARQEQESAKTTQDKEGNLATPQATASSANAGNSEEDMLAQALAMSMDNADGKDIQMEDVPEEALTEEEQIARAISLSMQSESNDQSNAETTSSDSTFMNSVLESLPGVDPNDPRVKSALQGLSSNPDSDKKEKQNDDEKKE